VIELFMKIAFFGVKSWERELIEREIINLDAVGVGIFSTEVQDSLDLASEYEVISVRVRADMCKEVLSKLPKLKMVAVRSTGIDCVDEVECKKRGIVIKNVPSYGENSVAEYAMALLLTVAKRIIPAHQSVEEGEFSPEGLTGIDIFGKTLGVVGVGAIGRNVIKIARGMGMKVLAVDLVQDDKLAKKIGFKYVELEECLRSVDFLTLHVPFTQETRYLINKKNIKLMQPGSVLINTARGAVVESEAIVWALNNKILWGAGLDVTEEEERLESMSTIMSKRDISKGLLSFHLLRDRDDVVFTPHNAFNTKEAIERIIKTTIQNINMFCKSESRKS
jgi:D-lactate dehydrogenase